MNAIIKQKVDIYIVRAYKQQDKRKRTFPELFRKPEVPLKRPYLITRYINTIKAIKRFL